jgi:hypothetical protein
VGKRGGGSGDGGDSGDAGTAHGSISHSGVAAVSDTVRNHSSNDGDEEQKLWQLHFNGGAMGFVVAAEATTTAAEAAGGSSSADSTAAGEKNGKEGKDGKDGKEGKDGKDVKEGKDGKGGGTSKVVNASEAMFEVVKVVPGSQAALQGLKVS